MAGGAGPTPTSRKRRGPPDGRGFGRGPTEHGPIELDVDGRGNDGDFVVETRRVACEIVVARHHLTSEAAKLRSFSRKLEVVPVAVRRALVPEEDRIVEVEDDGEPPPCDTTFDPCGTDERRLAEHVNQVEAFRIGDPGRLTRIGAEEAPHLFQAVPALVEDSNQSLGGERSTDDLDPLLAQKRDPLSKAKAVAGG